MQLKRPSTLRPVSMKAGLAAAVAGLLGGEAPADAQELGIDADSALLFYGETDRVSLVEGVVAVEKSFSEDQLLRLQLAFDSLTGASANGAIPSATGQTFTGPSGEGSYTIDPGAIPLDSTFHDTRYAGSLSWSRRLGRLNGLNLGITGSGEYDYASVGVNGGLTRDFDRRNTTLSIGGSLSSDSVKPVGGLPIPFAAMEPPDRPQPREGSSDGKTVVDGLIGITQVLGRSTLGRVNFSLNRSTGYLTDPYKVLSLVQPEGTASPGAPVGYLYERRPDARTRSSIFAEIRHSLGEDTVDLSYRYLWDDWGVRSHTAEGHYRWQMGGGRYLQPHLRVYRQTGADFFRHFLVEGEALPSEASADYRLGPMDALTLGLTLGLPVPGESVLRLTLEYYGQYARREGPAAFGTLTTLDLDPDVTALMARVGLSRAW